MPLMTRRLAEVAARAGVSEATVSRVLNSKPGVSEATRETVLTALDVLGYERPTKLRGERARLVGLVLPELQNPIFPAFAEVVGSLLSQSGLTARAVHADAGGRRARPTTSTCSSSSSRSSGIDLRGRPLQPRPMPTTTHYERLARRNLPSSSSTPSIELPFARVVCDDARSPWSRRSTTSPRSGHERIGLVLGPRRPRAVGAQARRRAPTSRRPAPRLDQTLVAHAPVLAGERPGRGGDG